MLIGVSSSSYQTEGNNTNTDWWHFEQTGRIKHKSGNACGSYVHYERDINAIKKLRLNSYRFSIEFARVMPAKDIIDYGAIDHYRSMIDYMRSKGITPIPTLWHTTLPKWFSDLGGFEKRRNFKFFLKYVDALLSRGIDADYVLTINEPIPYILQAYIMGVFPPFVKSFRRAISVYLNLVALHNLLYKRLKRDGYQVSFAHSMIYFGNIKFLYPTFKFSNYLYNTHFLKHTKYDFIGINYYRKLDVLRKILFRKANKSEMGWDVFPRGMHAITEMVYKTFKKPIMITENGIATSNDSVRKNFINSHFRALLEAKDHGVNVIGYHYWSLLDNFEWAYGYSKKFGIARVSRDHNNIIFKGSARILSSIARKYKGY